MLLRASASGPIDPTEFGHLYPQRPSRIALLPISAHLSKKNRTRGAFPVRVFGMWVQNAKTTLLIITPAPMWFACLAPWMRLSSGGLAPPHALRIRRQHLLVDLLLDGGDNARASAPAARQHTTTADAATALVPSRLRRPPRGALRIGGGSEICRLWSRRFSYFVDAHADPSAAAAHRPPPDLVPPQTPCGGTCGVSRERERS